MNKINKYGWAILFLSLAACQKVELPPESVDEVVFFVRAQADSGDLDVAAGVEHFALFPTFEQDSLGIFEYIARFEKSDCLVDCAGALTFKIRDANFALNGRPNVDETLRPGFLGFEVPTQDTVVFSSVVATPRLDLDARTSRLAADVGNVFEWRLNGQQVIQSDVPILDDVDISGFFPGQPFEVELRLSSTQVAGCESYQSQNIQFQNQNKSCRATIEMTNDSTGQFLTAVPAGEPPYLYFWNTNDTSQTIPVLPGIEEYTLVFIDANGCKANVGVRVAGDEFCAADFIAELKVAQDTVTEWEVVDNPFEFSKVILEYRTDDGRFFSSEWGPQPANAFFETLSVEPYDRSQAGFPTKKMRIRFACTLYDDSGETLRLTNGEGVIGVAFPE